MNEYSISLRLCQRKSAFFCEDFFNFTAQGGSAQTARGGLSAEAPDGASARRTPFGGGATAPPPAQLKSHGKFRGS